MILLDQVTKIYKYKQKDFNSQKALDGVNLYVRPKEFVVLIGPSGSGKSTLLKLLTCQEVATSGRVVVGGLEVADISKRDIPKLRRKIGFIFQDYKLLPKKTVVQNIAFALEITGVRGREIRQILPKVIRMVSLSGREYSLPSELSGGEMQRVAIARALMHQPKILLADEPTGNLDPENTWNVIKLLLKINKLGTTVILATHSQEIVRHLNKRTVLVENGRLYEDEEKIKQSLSLTASSPAAE